jgi:hypothetical protein
MGERSREIVAGFTLGRVADATVEAVLGAANTASVGR